MGGGYLAPKTMPRSHTSQEIGDSAQTLQPQPVPRQRSVDNIIAGNTAASDASDTTMPSSRPRPTPRKDVQSCIVDSDSHSANSRNLPSPSHRPGSVHVGSAASNGQTVASRTAPPPPGTRPAPPPAVSKHPSTAPAPAAVPTPPARPSRPSEKAVPKPSDPVDAFANSSGYHLGSHLLDRENSITEGSHSDPDPFDTAFANYPPPSFHPQPATSGLSDPFDTSHISSIKEGPATSGKASEKSNPDPFNTHFVAQTSQTFSDPFLARNQPFNHSSDAQNTSSSFGDSTFFEQNMSFASLTNNDLDQSASFGETAFQAPDMSPPPLPSEMGAPRFTPTPAHLTCPLEDPPPPPAVNPSGVPVPNRPGGVPPPVPRRPV